MQARHIAACLSLTLLLLSGPTRGEVYLQYGDVKGDVTASGYQDWIELNGFSFGIERSVEMTDLGSTQRGHANANLSKIVGQKEFTPSSPQLFLATASGTIEPTAQIHCVRTDLEGVRIPYFKIKLGNVVIDRFSQNAYEDRIPSETISLAYTEIELRGGDRDQKTGRYRERSVATYNIATGSGGSGGGPPDPPNTAPTISSVGPQSTSEDTAKTINFAIGDAQTAASSLQLAKASSNGTLLPSSRISFGGSAGARTVTLNPVANQFGAATVTLTVSDGSLSKSTAFTLTVASQNDRPIIIPTSSIQVIRTTPINGISVSDVDAETNLLSLAATVTQGSLSTNAVIPGLTVQNNGFSVVLLDGSLDTLNTLFSHSSGLIYQSYPNFTGTDTLSLQLTDDQGSTSIQQDITLDVFASKYDQWTHTYFSGELSEPSSEGTRWGQQADPDRDGLPNLLEYALGLNPDLPDAGHAPRLVETIVEGKRHYTLTIDRIMDSSIMVVVEVCTNLSDGIWSSDVANIDVSNVTRTADGEQLTFLDQKPIAESSQRFYRIVAVRGE